MNPITAPTTRREEIVDASTARWLWTLVENPCAASPTSRRSRGRPSRWRCLRGFWRGYFAGRERAARGGRAGPVVALFYGFAPRMVERALPGVWALAAPDAVLAARIEGAVAAIAALDVATDEPMIAEAASLAHHAVEQADVGGRALGRPTRRCPGRRNRWPRCGSAATVLRELRGDGHVAALLTSGLSGLDALDLRAGSDLDRAVLQPARG